MMEEQNFNEVPEEEVPEIYVPRPTWQVWLARTGLVIMAIGIALWLYNIAFPV
jgi:hypothetical protein